MNFKSQDENNDSREKAYPGWRGAIKLSLLLILFHLLSGAALSSIWGIFASPPAPFWLYGLISAAVNIGIIRYALAKGNVDLRSCLGKRLRAAEPYLITTFMVFGFSIISSWIVNMLRIFSEAGLYGEIVRMIRAESPPVLLIIIVIFPAVLEEIFFRGIIFRGLKKNYGLVIGLLFSSFLFGFVHFNFLQGVSAFLMGLLLGWLYWSYNSLFVVIYAHLFNNFLAVIFNVYFYIPGYSFSEQRMAQPPGFSVLGLILTGLGIYFVMSSKGKENEANS